MPEVRELTDDETLTYLHGCISTKRHPVATPETPAYLDAFLTDDDFQGGLLPRLGGPVPAHHLGAGLPDHLVAPACSTGSTSWASAIVGSAGICRWTRKTRARR